MYRLGDFPIGLIHSIYLKIILGNYIFKIPKFFIALIYFLTIC